QTSLEPVSYSVCSGSRGMTRALGGLDRTRFFTVHAPSMDESRPNRPLHNKPFRAASTGLGSTDQLAREAPRLSFYHADIDGLADELLASRKNDQLVLARTPREFAGIFVAYALDQHLNGAPHPFLVLFAADPILHLDQVIDAVSLDVFGHLLLEAGGRCADAGRIDKHKRAVKLDFLDEANRLHEIFVCLAGKTDDDVRRDRKIRYGGSHFLHQAQVLLSGVAPSHPPQSAVAAGLDRQV